MLVVQRHSTYSGLTQAESLRKLLEKHLRAIVSGNRLSNTLFTLMKGSVLPVPPTSDLG